MWLYGFMGFAAKSWVYGVGDTTKLDCYDYQSTRDAKIHNTVSVYLSLWLCVETSHT